MQPRDVGGARFKNRPTTTIELKDTDEALLKEYLTAKLSDISDADSDVLADYVIALVNTDGSQDDIRTNCVDSLRDFLNNKAQAESFVDSVLIAIASRTYDTAPSRPPAKSGDCERAPQQQKRGLKRSYLDRDHDDSQNGYLEDKWIGKRARHSIGGTFSRRAQHNQSSMNRRGHPPAHLYPRPPTPPPGMPTFDPNDPMATFIAMHEAMRGFTGMSDMLANRSMVRCMEYDTNGSCAAGTPCPFDHSSPDLMVSRNQYGPRASKPLDYSRGSNRARWSGTPRIARGSANIYPKQVDCTIIVSQIPKEHYDSRSITNYFCAFGAIASVSMLPAEHGALVQFRDRESTQAAFKSPLVIFDNRFVQVRWATANDIIQHTRAGSPQPQSMDSEDTFAANDDPLQDLEEVIARQAVHQKKFEQRKAALDQATREEAELDARLRSIAVERKALLARLAEQSGDIMGLDDASSIGGDDEEVKTLRARLASLEDEARDLGIKPGSTLARFSFSFRASGFTWSRPSGIGSNRSAQEGAVMRLDLRPKCLMITFEDGVYEDHEQVLRRWLQLKPWWDVQLSKHEARPDTALIAFAERYMAEVFMDAIASPPLIYMGKIMLSWYLGNNKHANDATGAGRTDVTSCDSDNPASEDEMNAAEY